MPVQQQPDPRPRAVRGLALVFVLSFLSLVGVMLTVTALGGLGSWTQWQFIGLFGLLECASGASNIVLPNMWRLPIAGTKTGRSTKIKLAPSVLLIPHWGAVARVAAGACLIAGALIAEGIAPASLLLLPCIALVAWLIIASSLIVARAGVAWPEHDVVQLVIVRPTRRIELPPVSIGASVLQFLLSIVTIPAIKLMQPAVFYQPAMAPSWSTLGVLVVLSFGALAAVAWSWQGRIDLHAPKEQRREAKRYA
jgi:hypothetical protein